MYIAEKDGMACRIPESKKRDYEFMGYTCKKIGGKEDSEKPARAQKSSKSLKADKTEESSAE